MALSLRAKRIIKYAALGVGCVVLLGGGFVLARWLASGAEHQGELVDLAPTEVALVAHIDDFAARTDELRNFLDNGPLRRNSLDKLEQSGLWRENVMPALGGSLRQFRNDTLEEALSNAEQQAKSAGLTLYKDVLEGEVLLCADFPGGKAEFVALSRVSRKVRFYWQFIGEAGPFLPSRRDGPKFSVSGGVLKVSSPANEDGEGAELLISLLADVMVVSNSPRLVNACLERVGAKEGGLAGNRRYQATLKLVDEPARKRHLAGLWLDLDRLRTQLDPVEVDNRKVSPVDAGRSLPVSVVRLNPDLFVPINSVLQSNLATEPFSAAYYGLDLSNPAQLSFDQYLLTETARLREFEHLRKTWAARAATPAHLDFLPPDTMFLASYRQPLDVLRDEVLDDRGRASFVGDFIRSFGDVKAEEVILALAPRSWAPNLVTPIAPKIPLPAFVVGFRIPGAQPNLAGDMLNRFLNYVRGRDAKDGELLPSGPLTVRPENIGGLTAFGFNDSRTEENDLSRLSKSIVVGVVGDWLLMTDSRTLLEHAVNARGRAVLAKEAAFSALPSQLHATLYLNFEKLAGYIGERQLLDELRKAKYDPNTIEGRDPGEVRRELAQKRGLDPNDMNSLLNPGVAAEFEALQRQWREVCAKEGPALINSVRNDLAGLAFFRDLSLAAVFSTEHLHARGVLRLR